MTPPPVPRRLLAAALLVAALTASGSQPVLAADDCLSLRYVAALSQADAALHATPPHPAQAAGLLSALVANDPTLHPVVDPVLADLSGSRLDYGQARDLLDALATTLALPAGSTCNIDSTAARNALHDVYGSPVFASLDQNSQSGFFASVGRAVLGAFMHISDALAWLFSHLDGAVGTPGTIALTALVLLGLAVLAARQVRRMLGAGPARVPDEPAGAGTDPEAEWRLAESAAGHGDHREAIRRAFRSALLEAVDRGRIHMDSAWTSRELLASMAGDAGMLAALAPAAASFDHAWYSGHPVSAGDWGRARARCQAVRTLAKRRLAAVAE